MNALFTPSATALRLASVSFLNARPLLWGLEAQDDLQLQLDVPSQLLSRLQHRQADVALLPVIDYQRLDDLLIVPSGGIGSDGHTLTVRIFSREPIRDIKTLACDSDSHTSVALARVILAERYGIHPQLLDLRGDVGNQPRLLIGDKVVTDEPKDFPYQVDLGEEWKQLTGLPFVFAIWMTRRGTNLRDLPARLSRAWQDGLRHVDEIVAAHAPARRWPIDLAKTYLTQNMQYQINERHLQAIRLFHRLAAKHGVIPSPRDLQCYPGSILK